MTADEEAAYVREVADQKTAALRMSLDAVERQQHAVRRRDRRARAAMPEGAVGRPRTGCPAVGGTRTVPAPDAVARDYLLLGLRLDQRIPGLVDGYFGPADLKATVDIEQPAAAGPAPRRRRRPAGPPRL